MKIDTTKINEYGKDLMLLSSEMNSLLDDMYERLILIDKNDIWVGTSAEKMIKQLRLDKEDAFDLKNELYQYGKYLCEVAEKYDFTIEQCGCDKL